MKFGLSFLPDARPSQKAPEKYFADALELSRLAEEVGLSTVKMTEHYIHPYGGYCPAPLAFLSAVASCTTRIRLMTGCLLPVFHHPLQLAAQCAMVDAISSGRLDVGFARAFSPYEFEAFDIPLNESRSRFEEGIEAILALWTQPSVSMVTSWFRLSGAACFPTPIQQPHPPVWIAAARSRQGFAWAAERGYNLLTALTTQGPRLLREQIVIYRETLQAAGKQGRVAVLIPLYIAESQEVAVREADVFLSRYHQVWADAADAWKGLRSSDYKGYVSTAEIVRRATPQWLRENNCVAVGDAKCVSEFVSQVGQSLNVDEILWSLDFGAMPLECSRRTMRLFASDVLPHLSTKG